MTQVRRSLAEIKDLLAIRLTCGQCKSAMSINALDAQNIPERCPNCRNDWYLTGTREQKALGMIFKCLEELHKSSGSSSCVVHFEFDAQAST